MTKLGERWLITFAVAMAMGVTAWSFFNGYILAYGDAESHLNIAKRVTDSITPGLAQLGGIWLPLPHLLLIPFTKIDILWQSGLAGSIVSGTAYIISCIYIYKTTLLITNNRIAGLTSYLVFATNPNILYMQSTAMTELPLIGFFIISIFYFIKFLRQKDNIFLLVTAGFFGLCATLSRYDGWPLVAAEGLILLINRIPKGRILMYATLAFSGILAWFIWDGVILGDPLYFTNSPFSAKSQQEGWLARGQLLTFHNLPLSTIYYSAAVLENLGIWLSGAAVAGLLLLITDKWFTEKWELLILLFVPFAFYTATMFLGQSIILIPELTPKSFGWNLFNIRYGLSMIPAAAILVGYLSYRLFTRNWWGGMAQGLILGIWCFQLILFATGEQKIMVWEDGATGLSSSLRYHLDAQNWMRTNYDGGMVMLDDYARTVSIIGSGIPMNKIIYVGNKPYWDISLTEPEKFATWIVMQKDDDIWKNIYYSPITQPRLYKYFQKVYTSPEVLIFKRNFAIK